MTFNVLITALFLAGTSAVHAISNGTVVPNIGSTACSYYPGYDPYRNASGKFNMEAFRLTISSSMVFR